MRSSCEAAADSRAALAAGAARSRTGEAGGAIASSVLYLDTL